ncbi:hypothetical protein V7147_24585 [Bacillus sp. JJ1521]|uniref:hypothetical protein n=1 Tax=Bacillus sp. JJ1521 TaxID=3122957 RepID=UPI003000736D
MIKRRIGISFIAIATILIVVEYFSKAIGGLLVGDTISNISLLALLVGFCYLSWGEYDEYKNGNRFSGR